MWKTLINFISYLYYRIYPDLILPEDLNIKVIRRSELNYNKQLEQGTFGTVYSGFYDGQMVAIKEMRTSTDPTHSRPNNLDTLKDKFFNEAKLLYKAQHACIVELLGIVYERGFEGPRMSLVFPEARHGDLQKYLQKNQGRDRGYDPVRKRIFLEITQAIIYLHSLDIIHRDLKIENILLDVDLHAQLTDFGFAKQLRRGEELCFSDDFMGTIGYIPPESVVKNPLGLYISGKPSDIYTLGIILMLILKDKDNYPYAEHPKLTHQELLYYIQHGIQQQIPYHYEDNLKYLITACWSRKIHERPTAPEVLTKLSQLPSFKQAF